MAFLSENARALIGQSRGYVWDSTTLTWVAEAQAGLGGGSTVQTVSTGSVRVHQSTIGDLLASVQQNSTVWQTQAKIQDSSAVGFIGTTTRPSTGAQGLVVRAVLNDLQSTALSTVGGTSTRTELVSSAAGLRTKVYAYSIMSTVVAFSTVHFASSNANPIWRLALGSQSSGITGANLAVSPPAWLFATESAAALNFVAPSAGPEFHVSFSYFQEA